MGCDGHGTCCWKARRGFQSTHPSGVRLGTGHISIFPVIFQSTHPSGVRLSDVVEAISRVQFQSTHPSGVRPGFDLADGCGGEISIHAPQWGATRTPAELSISSKFQSTHPSGVRQVEFLASAQPVAISIHAPQWGATTSTTPTPRTTNISIHAPQWGATARMGIAFHNMEAPSVLKTDFIAKIHVHRSIHKFSNQKHQQTIHF